MAKRTKTNHRTLDQRHNQVEPPDAPTARCSRGEHASSVALKWSSWCLVEPFFDHDRGRNAKFQRRRRGYRRILPFQRCRSPVSRGRTGLTPIVTTYGDPSTARHHTDRDGPGRALRPAIPAPMGKWVLAAFYDQANNRLRLRFPLRGPSVFSLDRGARAPLQFPSGISLIDRRAGPCRTSRSFGSSAGSAR